MERDRADKNWVEIDEQVHLDKEGRVKGDEPDLENVEAGRPPVICRLVLRRRLQPMKADQGVATVWDSIPKAANALSRR